MPKTQKQACVHNLYIALSIPSEHVLETCLCAVASYLSVVRKSLASVCSTPQGTRVCDVVFSVLPQFKDIHSGARFLTLSDPKYCGKMKVSSCEVLKFP